MIKWETSLARVEGLVRDERVERTLAAVLSYEEGKNSKREVQLNGSKISPRQAVGSFLTVLFSPDDIRLVTTSPARRRQYLDSVLGQLSQGYYSSLKDYQKALDQRNAFLANQSGNSSDQLPIWDQQLAEAGARLIKERSVLVEFFNTLLPSFYTDLSGSPERLEIAYHPNIRLPGVESLLSGAELRKLLIQALLKSRPSDIARQRTMVGPHRDDFTFDLDGHNLASSGSRGEFRSAVLALKLAEKGFVERKAKKQPILLLDDVFSELDTARRRALTNYLPEVQTFVTTTDLNFITDKLRQQAEIVSVKPKST